MKERRRAPRVNLKRGVLWRGKDTFDNLDQGVNISEGGVSFNLNDETVFINDLIQLSFELPTKKTIQAKAKIKWTSADKPPESAHRTGMEFVDISTLHRQEIRHFVGVCRYGCD